METCLVGKQTKITFDFYLVKLLSAVLTFKHTHTVHCKVHTLFAYLVHVHKSTWSTHQFGCVYVCAAKEADTQAEQSCSVQRRGGGRTSLSAYLTTERCTCCGCQVAGRFTSRAVLLCWSDFKQRRWVDLEGAQRKESRCHVRLFRFEGAQFDAGHKLPGWSEF